MQNNEKNVCHGRLPDFLSFKTGGDLIRLGKDFDGGYLVSETDVERASVLISLGVFDDWSFETDFLKINNVAVYAYDASVNLTFFAKRFLKSFYRLDRPDILVKNFKKLVGYISFFSKDNVNHITKFVGLQTNEVMYCTLDEIFEQVGYRHFFKDRYRRLEYRFLMISC